jgi:hypothetical protein
MTGGKKKPLPYVPLKWRGKYKILGNPDVEYVDHAYGPFEGAEGSIYLVQLTQSDVRAAVARHGEYQAVDLEIFELPKSPTDKNIEEAVEEARGHIEMVNRRDWQKEE